MSNTLHLEVQQLFQCSGILRAYVVAAFCGKRGLSLQELPILFPNHVICRSNHSYCFDHLKWSMTRLESCSILLIGP